MYLVDVRRVLRIRGERAREVLADILVASNEKLSLEVSQEVIGVGLSRWQLWRALSELAEQGIIKKGNPGKKWEVIWVNPAVFRPVWIRERMLKDAVITYVAGPQGEDMGKGKVGGATEIKPLSQREQKALAQRRRRLREEANERAAYRIESERDRLARLDESKAKPILVKK